MAFNLADVLKDVSSSDTGREQIEYISLSLIDEDPNNFYHLSDLDELAANIAFCGLQQPIRVRQKEDGRYIIVSGHRRRAAVAMLAVEDPQRWQEISCIVERDTVSPSLQQLRLIYANSNTRKMTSAEISQQAEQVEKLLYQLKEEGYDFPGRMRDHVAEAVQVSKSKLARLKVIRENLAACWADDWKNGTIGESVAYNLSQMPRSWQVIIHTDWGDNVSRLYADTVESLKKTFRVLEEVHCQHGLTLCEHAVYMMGKSCRDTSKNFYAPHCTGCCFDCSVLQTCKNCCPQAAAKQKEMKAVAKKAQLDAKLKQDERDRPGAEFARMVWDRIGKARERSGASIKDIVFARGESFYDEFCDDPKQKKMESGEGDYSPNSTVCFGYNLHASDVMHIVAVADVLGCSVDYLLGRTEDRQSHLSIPVEAAPVSYPGTTWHEGKPAEEGAYILLMRYDHYSDTRAEIYNWDGEKWLDGYDESYSEAVDGKIIKWIKAPNDMLW